MTIIYETSISSMQIDDHSNAQTNLRSYVKIKNKVLIESYLRLLNCEEIFYK